MLGATRPIAALCNEEQPRRLLRGGDVLRRQCHIVALSAPFVLQLTGSIRTELTHSRRDPAMKRSPADLARDSILRTGARVTSLRIEVLAVLLQAGRALTHQELERMLASSRGIDRVTLYRVLDWLVQYGLAHRIATGDRAWRFDAVDPEQGHRHAHFQCSDCGAVVCLDDVGEPPGVRLPAGFRAHEVELTVKGTCAHCGRRRRKPRKATQASHAHR